MRKLTQFEQFLRDIYDNDGSINFGRYKIQTHYNIIKLKEIDFKNLSYSTIMYKEYNSPDSIEELFNNRMQFIRENEEEIKELWYQEKLKELLNE